MHLKTMFSVAAFAGLSLSGSVAWAAERTPIEDTSGRSIVRPLVDHHQHLLSPEAAKLIATPLEPAISLPADLQALLAKRVQVWDNPVALAALYTDDATLFDDRDARWIRGGKEAAASMSRRFGRAYEMMPTAAEIGNGLASVSGYFTRGEGNEKTFIGFFQVNLKKIDGEAWRIALEMPRFPGPRIDKPLLASDLIPMLDEAGIRRAIVLSNGAFDEPHQQGPDSYRRVRAENDWTAQQVAPYGERLVAFCSFNPLADHALQELKRCSANPVFKGLKLHFNGSGVDLRNPNHLRKVQAVFAAADKAKLPILVHAQTAKDYGKEQAGLFVNQLLPSAPGIPVIMAHLWGGGGFSEEALAVYAEAVAAKHPATRNLYFEVAQAAWVVGGDDATLETIAKRMRQIGMDRIFYGSDAAVRGGAAPKRIWAQLRGDVPLTDHEFATLARNVAPFLERSGSSTLSK